MNIATNWLRRNRLIITCRQLERCSKAGWFSAYRATDLHYMADGSVASLEMNLADAYPAEANLQSWTRGVALDRANGQINIRDRFALKGTATQITWSLMTCREAKVEKGKLTFVPRAEDKSGAVTVEYDPTLLTANVETIKLTNAGLMATWGPVVYRVLLKTRQPMTNGESRLKVSRI